MTREDILAKWPRASESTIARNLTVGGVVSNSKCEPDSVNEPVGKNEGEVTRQGRYRVLVTSLRCRYIDSDNIALGAKPLVDALVEAGLIPSDSQKHAEILHKQGIVERGEMEYTTIEITPL